MTISVPTEKGERENESFLDHIGDCFNGDFILCRCMDVRNGMEQRSSYVAKIFSFAIGEDADL